MKASRGVNPALSSCKESPPHSTHSTRAQRTSLHYATVYELFLVPTNRRVGVRGVYSSDCVFLGCMYSVLRVRVGHHVIKAGSGAWI
jgi:hypothetical protein